MLVEVKVMKLGLDKAEKNLPVVILQELEGDRVLPIWIGPGEARRIFYEHKNEPFPRPLTHHLIHSVIGGMGGILDRIVISREENQTYFAELVIQRGEEVISVDARPSDSIAVALCADAPIFAEDSLLRLVSVEIADDDETSTDPDSREVPDDSERSQDLREYLRRLNPEDFGRFAP